MEDSRFVVTTHPPRVVAGEHFELHICGTGARIFASEICRLHVTFNVSTDGSAAEGIKTSQVSPLFGVTAVTDNLVVGWSQVPDVPGMKPKPGDNGALKASIGVVVNDIATGGSASLLQLKEAPAVPIVSLGPAPAPAPGASSAQEITSAMMTAMLLQGIHGAAAHPGLKGEGSAAAAAQSSLATILSTQPGGLGSTIGLLSALAGTFPGPAVSAGIAAGALPPAARPITDINLNIGPSGEVGVDAASHEHKPHLGKRHGNSLPGVRDGKSQKRRKTPIHNKRIAVRYLMGMGKSVRSKRWISVASSEHVNQVLPALCTDPSSGMSYFPKMESKEWSRDGSAELFLSRFFSNLLGRHLEINLSNRDVYMQRSCEEMRSRGFRCHENTLEF